MTSPSPNRAAILSAAALLTLCAGTLHAQTLTRVSTNYAGTEIPNGGSAPVINPNGTRVLFTSSNSNTLAYNIFGYPTARTGANIYLKTVSNNAVSLISWTGSFSQPPELGSEPLAINLAGTSSTASIGSNGNVAFLNAGDQSYMNGLNGVFVECLPSSSSTNYTYVNDGGGLREDGHEGWVGHPCDGPFVNASMNDPCISPEGTYVAFSTTSNVPGLNLATGTNSDTNGVADVYLKNFSSDSFTKVSLAGNAFVGFTESNGASRRPSVGNGNTCIAFESDATNLGGTDNNGTDPDIFVRDLSNTFFPVTQRVSVSTAGVSGNGPSTQPSISGDGRFVTFLSTATNLAGANAGNRQVYLRDRTGSTTVMVSRGYDNAAADADCSLPRISPDGNWIVYYTAATNIVRGDTNALSDTFVYSVATGTTRRVSVNTPNFPGTAAFQGNGASTVGDVSSTIANGVVRIAFQSAASNLVANDTNGATDVFIRNLAAIPANDLCANATAATAGTLYTGDTSGAAVDGVSSCGASTGSPDVWFTTTAAHNGAIVADTEGSSFDTMLSAFLGCGGSELACNDDVNGGADRTSRISFAVTAGQNIRFRVAGYSGNVGAYHFTYHYTCGAADLGVQGGLPGSDGQLDNNDFIAFINYFFAADPHADLGVQGGLPGSDGHFDNNDFIAFINLFFAGCS